MSEAGGGIKTALSSLWQTLEPILAAILDVIAVIITVIIGQLAVVIDTFTKVVGSITDILSGIIDFVVGVFTGDWERAWNGVVEIFSGIGDAIKAIVEHIVNSISNAMKNIKEAISSLLGSSKSSANIKVNQAFKVSSLDVPKLAKGGVITSPTVAMMGEYAGASRNPEIVAPQSILQQVMVNSNSELMNAIYSIGNQISKSVEEKDTDIYMDTAKITRRITKEQDAQRRQMGTSLVLV